MRCNLSLIALIGLAALLLPGGAAHGQLVKLGAHDPPRVTHAERQTDRPTEAPTTGRVTALPTPVVRGSFVSVQVNVNALGNNVVGDAANEPSIAVDPTNPNRIAIGWRQFDTVANNFRQAGVAYSDNAGLTWTFPGVLDPGQFRSDPILASDADGTFYYYSLSSLISVELFKSTNGGVTWGAPVPGFGGDKAWMTIDRTSGPGRGHIYTIWNEQFSCCEPADFARSINGGVSFQTPLAVPLPSMKWGTLDVGPDGTLYLAGSVRFPNSSAPTNHLFTKSTNAQNSDQTPIFQSIQNISLGGIASSNAGFTGPNPAGLLGQVWIATDHSAGPTRGNVYVLASIDPPSADPRDIMFIRSTDGGASWTDPLRVNDDATDSGAWQWFGTMSVAPNGRIDVVWNDTRNTGLANRSELFYTFSLDAGSTWARNVPVSPVFNSHLGFPDQNKLGDYYHMVSDNAGANLAYAATFNGEQDVYFLRIPAPDCNENGILDEIDIAECLVGDNDCRDCNLNGVPDGCEPDCNDSGKGDACDVIDGGSPDCDGNLVPDECEADFDGDGLIDGCDADRDGDGVPNDFDECPFTPLGLVVNNDGRPISDTNTNCVVELSEFKRFANCISNGGPTHPHVSFCFDPYDYTGDETIDLRDYGGFQNALERR